MDVHVLMKGQYVKKINGAARLRKSTHKASQIMEGDIIFEATTGSTTVPPMSLVNIIDPKPERNTNFKMPRHLLPIKDNHCPRIQTHASQKAGFSCTIFQFVPDSLPSLNAS